MKKMNFNKQKLTRFQYCKCMLTVLICMCWVTPASATDYYINNQSDYDNINNLNLNGGDRVLLKSGVTFNGTINLDGSDSGSSGNYVVIDKNGTSKPTIRANSGYAIKTNGTDWLKIQNLLIDGPGRTVDSEYGIQIENGDNIIIDDIEVKEFQKGGIRLYGKCQHVDITDVFAHHNGYVGITTDAQWPWSSNVNDWHNDIYIGRCRADQNAGDPTRIDNHSGNGILIGFARNVIAEKCRASDNGWDQEWTRNGPVGIWAFNSTNVTIQYCIARRQSKGAGSVDGNGFGFDAGVQNSVIQYCYAYDCEGAGIYTYHTNSSWVKQPWKNNIFRYNIVKNCANKWAEQIRCGGHPGSELQVYNNTVVSTNFKKNKGGNAVWKNNIFYCDTGSGLDSNKNFFSKYGQSPDPKLKNSGITDNLYDVNRLSSLTAYQIKDDSPCKNAGISISGNGGKDLFGHSLYKNSPDV